MKMTRFLCFATEINEEENAATGFHEPPAGRPRRRRLRGNITSAPSPSSKRCGRSPEDSMRLAHRMPLDARSAMEDRDSGTLSSSSPNSRPSSPSTASPVKIVRTESKSLPAASGGARRCGVVALCLLVVSLMVMVFCGRICAILWTASWLCLLPRRNPVLGLQEFCSPDAAPPADTAAAEVIRRKGLYEYEKKRVVFEGFLERNKRVWE